MTTDTIPNHHTWGIIVLEMKLSIIQVNIPIINMSVDMNIIELVMYVAQLLIADQVMINMKIIINIVMYEGFQVTDTVIKVAAVNKRMYLMVRTETATDTGKKVDDNSMEGYTNHAEVENSQGKNKADVRY